jgi:hypothetical protein
MSIHCCGNVVTEPLPSNDRWINIHKLMGGIYEVRHCDELRCHDVHTRFYEDWFRYSNLIRGDTQTHRQHGNLISPPFFFQNKENCLKKVGFEITLLFICCISALLLLRNGSINTFPLQQIHANIERLTKQKN